MGNRTVRSEGGYVCGTDISKATATYTVGATTFTQNSASVTTRVAELLGFYVVWQDAANITVTPGDTNQVLTFRVTNTGNGMDTYTL